MSNLNIDCAGFDLSLFNPTQFQLSFSKLPNLSFLCQTINMPEVSFGTATAPTPFHDLHLPGEKLEYGIFSAEIILDKNLVTYKEIYKWMKDISVLDGSTDWASNCLIMLGTVSFKVKDVYPISISSMQLSKTIEGSPPLVFSASFNFTTFDLI